MTEPADDKPRSRLDGRVFGGAFAAWAVTTVLFITVLGSIVLGSDWLIGMGMAGVALGLLLLVAAIVQFIRPRGRHALSFLLAALLIGLVGYALSRAFLDLNFR